MAIYLGGKEVGVIIKGLKKLNNEFDLILSGNYGYLTDEQATAILNGTYTIGDNNNGNV